MASNKYILTFLLALISVKLKCVSAHDNGMDMSMDGAMSLASGNMLSYIHFTPGDVILFQGWVPRSTGPMVGACIGLFLLALFDRWLVTCQGLMESHCHKRAQISVSNRLNTSTQVQSETRTSAASTSSLSKGINAASAQNLPGGGTSKPTNRHTLPPLMPVYDVPRGLLHAAASALEFAFMLIVMTYQGVFIISIVVGHGVGEMLFGRYKPQAHIY